MMWKKLGKLYTPKVIDEYLVTHAANPLAIHLHEDIFRIFYSGRNKDNKSSVGYVELDIIKKKIINVCNKTAFKVTNDSFYSHGISIGNTYHVGSETYMLFMAWQIKPGQHWRGDIGRLRVSKDLNKLELIEDHPFLSSDSEDQISLSYPWVIYDDGIYKMWYGSTINWQSPNGEMVHVIKYATSPDGEQWEKRGLAIPYELGVAQAFSRPSVIKDQNGYHMWFSYRSGTGQKYRIGYAHSLDGLIWDRKESGIDVSKSGWDSEMICYPYVFDHKDERYMLYNGNGFGDTGFGIAVLEE